MTVFLGIWVGIKRSQPLNPAMFTSEDSTKMIKSLVLDLLIRNFFYF